jgi:hypothetical protein
MPVMTHQVIMIVLWADELRNAAQALKRMHDLPDDAPEADWRTLVRAALDACTVALHGADDESATLLLSVKPAHLVAVMDATLTAPAPQ